MPVCPWGKGYIHIAGMKNTRGKEEYVNRLLSGIEGARDCGGQGLRGPGIVGCTAKVTCIVSTCSWLAQNAKSSFVEILVTS